MTKRRWIAAGSALGIVIAAALTTAAVMRGGSARSTDDSPLVSQLIGGELSGPIQLRSP